MNPSDLSKLADKFPLSASTRRRNLPSPAIPERETISPPANPLFDGGSQTGTTGPATVSKRIRQSSKPLLNKLETEWYRIILSQYPNYPMPRAQAKRYRLGNGIWYKPDFSASSWPRFELGWPHATQGPACETCWEVKGPHSFRGGLENLKVAASTYPEVRWILVWKQKGQWQQQEVLP